MAGDWIKMRNDLQTHPKVVRILSAMRPHDVQTMTDKFRVIGGLHAVWGVFDIHSTDGHLPGYTPEMLDHIIGWEGFANAMMGVGWLVFDGAETLVLPEFDEHNGQSGKRRAEDQKRKRNARKSESNPQIVRKLSANEPDNNKTESGLEKRREEYIKPSSEKSDLPDGFAKFWDTWPKSDRKVAKSECLKRWKARGLENSSAAIMAHLQAAKETRKWREGFDPAPLTYLNLRLWEDGVPESNSSKPWDL